MANASTVTLLGLKPHGFRKEASFVSVGAATLLKRYEESPGLWPGDSGCLGFPFSPMPPLGVDDGVDEEGSALAAE